jgi:hypothetical protein
VEAAAVRDINEACAYESNLSFYSIANISLILTPICL